MAQTSPIWTPKGVADDADAHVAFRGTFTTAEKAEIQILGTSQYLVWLDGKLVHDGPARFAKAFPEYQSFPTTKGRHTIAIHVHNEGVTTRILSEMPAFLWCQLSDRVPISWKCARIPGYHPRAHRISDILGWIDWVDTAQVWPNWQQPDFDDSKWLQPVEVDPGIGPITPAKTKPVRLNPINLKPSAQGHFTSNYGYEMDDPAVRFFLDDLDPKGVPPQGVWRRYDLGQVRLGRPKFTLDLPKGAIVEFALSEELRHGRAHAWMTLSGSKTCNFDHFVARGGPQEFMPTTPKGGRFLEVHVKSTSAKFLKEEFLERTYHGEPEGSFTCDDPLLNRIWTTGVNTMRACSEDSFVDCPTRERGQWTGDVASVAMDINAVAYSDLGLARRALVQAAQAARSDGIVAGVGPGDPGYLSTYAAQWVTACVHYWELTGDKSLLEELHNAAEKNLAAFQAQTTADGASDNLGWAFIDWGYVRNAGPTDMALNIHYLMALRSMVRWNKALGIVDTYNQQATSLEKTIKNWLKGKSWSTVGYHRSSLALLADLVPTAEIKPCIETIEKHLLTCFPNDPTAPRLSDPSVANERIMTPYFCHFAFAALLEHGEIDFVLSQFRKCWGWALGDNRTTWLEVFDTRWSHCHEWSGCPTWQLTRHVLGLRPRFDLGVNTYDLHIQPGNLKQASGAIPTPNGQIQVSWTKSAQGIAVNIQTPSQINVRIGGQVVSIEKEYKTTIK